MPTTFITGANRGIGLELARQYAERGWRVYAACRKPDAAAQLQRLVEASSGSVQALALDAAADTIRVEILEGGRRLIKVTDVLALRRQMFRWLPMSLRKVVRL